MGGSDRGRGGCVGGVRGDRRRPRAGRRDRMVDGATRDHRGSPTSSNSSSVPRAGTPRSTPPAGSCSAPPGLRSVPREAPPAPSFLGSGGASWAGRGATCPVGAPHGIRSTHGATQERVQRWRLSALRQPRRPPDDQDPLRQRRAASPAPSRQAGSLPRPGVREQRPSDGVSNSLWDQCARRASWCSIQLRAWASPRRCRAGRRRGPRSGAITRTCSRRFRGSSEKNQPERRAWRSRSSSDPCRPGCWTLNSRERQHVYAPSTVPSLPQAGDLVELGADDGIRTRDPHLGKVMLYQLSHVRVSRSG